MVRHEGHGTDKEFGTGRGFAVSGLEKKSVTKSQDQQEVHEPETTFGGHLHRVPVIKLVHIPEKCLFVKEAIVVIEVEFNGVEQIEGMVYRRQATNVRRVIDWDGCPMQRIDVLVQGVGDRVGGF